MPAWYAAYPVHPAAHRTAAPSSPALVYILALLLPIIGLIVGCIWLADDEKRSQGCMALLLGIVGCAVWGVVLIH